MKYFKLVAKKEQMNEPIWVFNGLQNITDWA